MKTGAFRRKKTSFTQVSNHIIQNPNISTSAKGLYTIINSYINIPDWTLYKNFLLNQCKESKTAFERMWKELKNEGYLKQYRVKDTKTGMFIYEYDLLDVPEIEQTVKNQHAKIENTKIDTTNNNSIKNNRLNNNNKSVDVDESLLNNLSQKIQKTIDSKVSDKKLIELLNKKDESIINKYLDNWDKFKDSVTKSKSGYFISIVENEAEIPINDKITKINNTKSVLENFMQREYEEDDYEKFYSN